MSNHIIITRFHYQKNDPRFEWRFAYYQAMVLARLQAQTDSDFHIGIWCYDHHRNLFEKLDNS